VSIPASAHDNTAQCYALRGIAMASNLSGATENAGPGQCRTWKMTDQIAGLENAGPGKCLGSKMPDYVTKNQQIFVVELYNYLEQVTYLLLLIVK